MAQKSYRKGAIPYGFIAVPKDVLTHPDYLGLPAASKALLFDVAVQFTGKNNGRLSPGFEAMKRAGWTSKTKLIRAKRALLECVFTMQTRIGHPPRTAEWWGFTWWKLDYHESMEVNARGWPYLNFLPALSVVPKRDLIPAKPASSGTESGPMKRLSTALSVPNRDHATEVRAEKSIGTESGHVLEVAISAPLSPGPLSSSEFKGGPVVIASLIEQARRRTAANRG